MSAEPICGGHSAPSTELPEGLAEIVTNLSSSISESTGASGSFAIAQFTQQVRFFLLKRRSLSDSLEEEEPLKEVSVPTENRMIGNGTGVPSLGSSNNNSSMDRDVDIETSPSGTLISAHSRRRSVRTKANDDAWLSEALLSLSPPRFSLADDLAVWTAHADRCLFMRSCGLVGFVDDIDDDNDDLSDVEIDLSLSLSSEPMLIDDEEELPAPLDDAGWAPPPSTAQKAQSQRRSNTKPKTQVVAGMIYHVKLEAEGTYVHARIFKPLPHTGAAASLQVAKSGFGKDDELAVLNPE
ncbi:hypothetical protein TrLO_g8492 [Triparma laevis f. longispina]|uniref:Uncharacterized protein n=1 Tax=Triparma laevis f. longispina TaxID=1714387 RepID=A0A9W7C7L6_9STRA|nr:hypothetical protein TrLO_g8492 [Triparma laevis f. longispina]